MEVTIILLFVIILIGLLLIDVKIKFSKQKRLHGLVAWCSVVNINNCHYESDYTNLIIKLQNQENIRNPYLITNKEIENIKIIIREYQNRLKNNYFNNLLVINKKIYNMTEEQYFMYTLCDFLKVNECMEDFYGIKMYTQISRTNYGTWGVQNYDATYKLNDFSILYSKLFYITELYCENNLYDNKTADKSNAIKKRIDTKQIEISVLT